MHRVSDGLYSSSRISELPQKGLVHDGDHDHTSTVIAILRACAKHRDLCRGNILHNQIRKSGILKECSDALVTMYAKCGEFEEAKKLFDRYKSRDVLTWTALIAALAKKGQGQDALEYFEQMQREGLAPDAVTFICILKACASIGALDKGKKFHDEIAKQGLLRNNIALGNALVNMYAKCGSLTKARQVLEGLPRRNVVSWTAIIAGYAQQGEGIQAIRCLEQMQQEHLAPNAVTYVCILKACGGMRALDKGEAVHDDIAKQGLLRKDVTLGNALVDMYVKCGVLSKARRVLEELPVRDVISWNSLITGYAQQGAIVQALDCFEQMRREGLSPSVVTFICILKACGSTGTADRGKKVHSEVTKQGLLQNDIVLSTALVDMYAKCGALPKAQQVLLDLPARDVISWSALITGYAEQCEGKKALICFKQMKREGLYPDAVTLIAILKACGSIGAVDKGEEIHDEIVRQKLLANNLSLGTALVDMYAKCGTLAKARQVLEDLPTRDVFSWSALITGYAQQGEGAEALKCFEKMQGEGFSPDAVALICLLKACGNIGAADKGEKIHDEVAKHGLVAKNIVIGNALVDMYAKCGALSRAQEVLEELPVRDATSWNALVAGYAHHGESAKVLSCFQRMQSEGLLPDAATVTCVLSACSRLGLVQYALTLFDDIKDKYGLDPDLDQYTWMVDVLGRAGQLDKASEVIEKMPPSNSGVWSVLLGACLKWGDVNVGRWAFDHAVDLDKNDGAIYVFMSNIYAAAGMKEQARILKAMRVENNAVTTSSSVPSCGTERILPWPHMCAS